MKETVHAKESKLETLEKSKAEEAKKLKTLNQKLKNLEESNQQLHLKVEEMRTTLKESKDLFSQKNHETSECRRTYMKCQNEVDAVSKTIIGTVCETRGLLLP